MSNSILSLTLLAALAGGCTATTRSRTYFGEPVQPTVSRATRAWRAAPSGMESLTLGFVVQFDAETGDLAGFWSVRNAFHQELGMIDTLGRAWRYEPHMEEARLLGAGTVAEGAGSILGASGGVTLIDVPIAELDSQGSTR